MRLTRLHITLRAALVLGLVSTPLVADTDLADADALFQRGIQQGRGDGNYAAGLMDLRGALEIVREHAAPHLETQLWTWIAAFQLALDDHRAAETSLRQALTLLDARDVLGRWWIEFSIATVALADGRPEAMDAEALIRGALVLEARDTPLRDYWIGNLRDFGRRSDSGNPSPPSATAVLDSTPLLRSMAEAVARLLRGHQLAEARRFGPAIEQLRLAAAASKRADGFYSTTIVETLAATLAEDQQLDGAIEVLEVRLAERPPISLSRWSHHLVLLSTFEEQLGRHGIAGQHLHEALRLARSLGDSLRMAEAHDAFGGHFLRLGHYQSAAGHLERAFELFEELGHPRAASSHARLDLMYRQLGAGELTRSSRPSTGEPAFRIQQILVDLLPSDGTIDEVAADALRDLIEEIPTEQLTLETFERLDRMAAFLEAAGDARSPDDLERLAAPLDQSSFASDRWLGLLITAKVDLDHKRWREALAKIDQVLDEHRQSPEPGAGVWAHYLRSLALWQGNRSDEALRAIIAALDAHDAIAADTTVEALDTARRGHGLGPSLYARAVTLHARLGKTAEAFHLTERSRAQTLARLGGPDVGPVDWVERSPMLNAMRAEIADLEERSRDAASEDYRRLRRELADARRRFEHRMIRGKVRAARSTSRLPVAVLDLGEARSLLGPDEVLVSYYTTDRQLVRWVLDADQADLQVLDLDAETLERWIDCWLRSLATGAGRSTRVAIRRNRRATMRPVESCGPHEAVGGALYGPLLQGLDLDSTDRRLFVVPHGPLHAVPFAALRDPLADRYLVEDIAVVHLPSAGSLAEYRLGGSDSQDNTAERSEILVVGDPISYLPVLPGARREAIEVARSLGIEPLLGDRATETAIRSRLATSRLVHIAAHGVFDAEDPRFSRLALAGDATADGFLEVHEILDLPLAGVERVVLSGCQTGLGEITAGDDVIGLARSWLFAGARSVISTLWTIDDDASTDLMVSFYRRIEAGTDPVEALRQAQLALLRNAETRSPTFWAAFTYWGDPSPAAP